MIPKMISGILAAILIAVVLYASLPSIWFWIVFEVFAALLVAIGCSGEWYLHHHPAGRKKVEKEEHHKLESRFIAAVVIGVFMEFFALGHAIPEAIRLEKDVASANERASANESQVAVLSNETVNLSIKLEGAKSNNLVLRTNVTALETAVFRLAKQYDMSTNALAEANARLSLIKPLNERLVDCLNIIAPEIVAALTKTPKGEWLPVRCGADSPQRDELENLCRDPSAGKYIRQLKIEPGVTWKADGRISQNIDFILSTELLQ